jgi:hypothetical protein
MNQNQIEQAWREFYLPYEFGELHSRQKGVTLNKKVSTESNLVGANCPADTLDECDNPMEDEQFIQEHKYTTEEI